METKLRTFLILVVLWWLITRFDDMGQIFRALVWLAIACGAIWGGRALYRWVQR